MRGVVSSGKIVAPVYKSVMMFGCVCRSLGCCVSCGVGLLVSLCVCLECLMLSLICDHLRLMRVVEYDFATFFGIDLLALTISCTRMEPIKFIGGTRIHLTARVRACVMRLK